MKLEPWILKRAVKPVSQLSGYELDGQVSIYGRGVENFSFVLASRTASWSTQPTNQWISITLFARINTWRSRNCLPHPIKCVWILTSTFPDAFTPWPISSGLTFMRQFCSVQMLARDLATVTSILHGFYSVLEHVYYRRGLTKELVRRQRKCFYNSEQQRLWNET